MNVVVIIKGREAIPVRAIPFLTNWETMSPDEIASMLASDGHFWTSQPLHAYVMEDENLRAIEENWWENFACRELEALSDSIKATETTHETGYQEWRERSLAILPAAAFVWKEEFALQHATRHGSDGTVFITHSGSVKEEVEQQKRMTLNFDPFIPDPKLKSLIMEGFEVQELDTNPKSEFEIVENDKPWLIVNNQDPIAEQSWYTPARYLAREFVKNDTTLLSKRLILADKVSANLFKLGIKKRGNKAKLAAETVLKSFANVKLG
jgi:hypothetical protein